MACCSANEAESLFIELRVIFMIISTFSGFRTCLHSSDVVNCSLTRLPYNQVQVAKIPQPPAAKKHAEKMRLINEAAEAAE